jgi:hypothetical protein
MRILRTLRDHLGPHRGVVGVSADGPEARLEALGRDSLHERNGRLVIPASGVSIDDELVRSLRQAGCR